MLQAATKCPINFIYEAIRNDPKVDSNLKTTLPGSNLRLWYPCEEEDHKQSDQFQENFEVLSL